MRFRLLCLSLAALVGQLFSDHKPLWSEALRAVVEADAERAVELFRELGRGDAQAHTAFGSVQGRKSEFTEPISGGAHTVDETIPDEHEKPAVQLDADQRDDVHRAGEQQRRPQRRGSPQPHARIPS